MRISDWSSDVCSSDLAFVDMQAVGDENEIEFPFFGDLRLLHVKIDVGAAVDYRLGVPPTVPAAPHAMQDKAQLQTVFHAHGKVSFGHALRKDPAGRERVFLGLD